MRLNQTIKHILTIILTIIISFPAISFAKPEYSYKWISQSNYVTLYPEESARLWVLVENTGNASWNKDIPIHLGTSNPLDRPSDFFVASDWLSTNRAAWLTDDTTIKPGERAVFMFNIVAPTKPGIYQEFFRPVVEGINWLEDYGIYWEINVKSPEETAGTPHNPQENYQTDGIYRSELVYQESPSLTLKQGESKTLKIEIKNVGTATWHNIGQAPVRLGTGNPWDRTSIFQDKSWLASNRVTVINENNIDPSETASYTLTLHVPDNAIPGYYEEKFESVAENVSWFKDFNITYKISVKSSNPIYGEIISNDDVDQFVSSGVQMTITDIASQRNMRVQAIGMDHWHSDVFPIDKAGTDLIRDIYNFRDEFIPWCDGDDWILWKPNAVTVQIDSDPLHRSIAAAMVGCPHDVDGGNTINEFPGHFCLHFLNSMQHGKSETDCSFQKMVQKAGGNPNWATYGQSAPCWNPCIGGGC